MMFSELKELENAIGFSFEDKTLLQRALVHRSFLNENPDFPLIDNERLEFLGDAVLDFISASFLYHRFPEMREGELTALRAALVRTETLASFAQEINLGRFLLLGKGEEESGGRERISTLCAAFEALVGAIYLDRGLDVAIAFIQRFMEPETKRLLQGSLGKDPKSLLQEISQARFHLTPSYHTVAETGPDHAKEFTVEVRIGDKVYGQGRGRSKQAAEQEAARIALERGLEEGT